MKRINNKTIIIVISILIIILLILLVIMKLTMKNKEQANELINKVSSYTTIDDFKTIEEVAAYLECSYIKQENSKDKNYNTDVYMKIKLQPYTNENSNKGFYNKLIAYSASALKYQSFRIIDKQNNITIEVICDSKNKKIKSTMINGETDYFEKHDSYLEISKIDDSKKTKLNIQSNILNKLIEKNWRISDSEFGTKESTFNSYDIYFDEGIEVRNIDNKVFNIVFTEKYKDKVVNNITTSTSKDQIIKILGEPTFSDERFNFIGYKSEDIYLFYNSKKEISIYRVEKNYDSTKFTQIVDNYLENRDSNKLLQDLKNEYSDFDKYVSDSNGVILQYSLKGIIVRFQKGLSKGIQIYNNYEGKIYKDISLKNIKENITLPEGIFIKNEDAVSKTELERIQNEDNMIFEASDERSKYPEISQSKKYYTIKTNIDENTYKIKFISSDNSKANRELRENINYYVWIDDDNFVYSIKNRGIYLYNLSSMKYRTLITGNNEEFKIVEYKNNILKYDEKSVKLK